MSDRSHTHSPEDDLAFLRSVVEGGGQPRFADGAIFLAGGLLYGLQCLFHMGQLAGVIRWPGLASLAFVAAVSLTFLVVLGWALMKGRGAASRGTTASRAMNAVFGGAGLANLAMVIVFGVSAARSGDFHIWLFYPAVVFAVLGAAWFVDWSLKRGRWRAAVAAGWLVAATALGLLRYETTAYLAVCAAALFLLMALPGLLMIRAALRADRG